MSEQTRRELQRLTEEYHNQQKKLNKHIIHRQHYETQMNENRIVKEEFNHIDTKNKQHILIFKSVANVLLKQDFDESKSIVNRRIDFLKNELSKVEKKIESSQTSIEESRQKIIEFQTKLKQEVPSKQLSETHLLNSSPTPPTSSTT